MNQKKKFTGGFLGGVSALTISALAVKIIGLLYRIPMLSCLGTEGMGYFNTAYELYALFCVIATAGLPVAMSVLISASEAATYQNREAQRIFHVSIAAFFVLGIMGMLLLYGFSDALAALFKNSGAAAGMRMISPTVLLICLSSAFRGYFQGKRHMIPTAVSQVIEASGKLILGLLFAWLAQRRGCGLPETAAFAVLGLTLGTGISVVYLWIHKLFFDASHSSQNWPTKDFRASLDILARLLKTAIPVTLGAAVLSMTKVVDLALILRRLQAVGIDEASANALYGCYSTLVLPLFHMLPTLTTSVSLPTVPALSAALGQKNDEGIAHARTIIQSALRLTLLIAIPAAIGLSVFSEDVLTLLFGTRPEAVHTATPWLTCIAWSVPMSCLITVSSALLQGAGYASKPVISLICGTIAKAFSAYILLGIPSVGMMGAPISTLLCDGLIVVLNFVYITRLVPGLLPESKDFLGMILFPLTAGGGAVAAVWMLRRCFGWQGITPLHTIGTVLTVACVYGTAVLLSMRRKTAIPPRGGEKIFPHK